ncbi:hypothetical protein [Nostoc sp. UHCC 0252]|nr:hypothetical protein [Nostoc sp. UHCC 0252]MEA5602881.1 hypothetical protein [Nostoc sp. UHCC 0252]
MSCTLEIIVILKLTDNQLTTRQWLTISQLRSHTAPNFNDEYKRLGL